jgi:hypothetical protein
MQNGPVVARLEHGQAGAVLDVAEFGLLEVLCAWIQAFTLSAPHPLLTRLSLDSGLYAGASGGQGVDDDDASS